MVEKDKTFLKTLKNIKLGRVKKLSIVLCDTREKQNKNIISYFDKNNIDYIITKLDAGDYTLYKDFSTIIDKKNGLLELSKNLCNTKEHERIKRELERARKLECKDFIFLIQDSKIKSVEDIKNWSSPHTRVRGETLLKIMLTMKKKYDVRFIICSKKDMAKKIIELLGVKK